MPTDINLSKNLILNYIEENMVKDDKLISVELSFSFFNQYGVAYAVIEKLDSGHPWAMTEITSELSDSFNELLEDEEVYDMIKSKIKEYQIEWIKENAWDGEPDDLEDSDEIEEPIKKSILIVGPQGSGKTTKLRELYETSTVSEGRKIYIHCSELSGIQKNIDNNQLDEVYIDELFDISLVTTIQPYVTEGKIRFVIAVQGNIPLNVEMYKIVGFEWIKYEHPYNLETIEISKKEYENLKRKAEKYTNLHNLIEAHQFILNEETEEYESNPDADLVTIGELVLTELDLWG